MSRQEIYDTRLAHSRLSGECQFKPRYGNLGPFRDSQRGRPDGPLGDAARYVENDALSRFGVDKTRNITPISPMLQPIRN
jgi:hypothetical protein